MSPPVVFTIGHSTRTIDDFVHLLKAHRVQRLVDVRVLARSRFNPQFDTGQLPVLLEAKGIRYSHMPGLGGWRRPRPDSVNSGWRNPGFRGYADYMQTSGFAESLKRCLDVAAAESVVLMCAEAVPWRCHRSLIADALLIRGIHTCEIVSDVRTRRHQLTPFAQVNGLIITYPHSLGGAQPAPEDHRRWRG